MDAVTQSSERERKGRPRRTWALPSPPTPPPKSEYMEFQTKV